MEKEKFFENIVQASMDQILVVDGNANLTYVNNAFLTEMGYEENQVLGKSAFNLMHPDSIESVGREFAKLLEGQDVRDYVGKCMTSDGKVLYFETNATAVRDENGEFESAIIIARNISGQKRAEELLRESEEKYHRFTENSPDMIMRWKPDIGTVYVNPAFEKILGYKAENVLNNWGFFMSIVHEDDMMIAGGAFQRLQQIRNSDKRIVVEFRVFAKSGEMKWIEFIWVPVWEGEKLVAIDAMGRDTTERKKAEEILKTNESRFRSYFNNPVIGIAITSIEKGWIAVNKRLTQMLGYTIEELREKTWAELTYPADIESNFEKFNRVLAGDIDSYSMDKRYICKDGSIIWTTLGVSCVRKSDGAVDYFVSTLHDITDRKKVEEEQRENEQRIRNIADSLPGTMLYTARAHPDGRREMEFVRGAVQVLHGCSEEEAMEDASRIYDTFADEERSDIETHENTVVSEFEEFKKVIRLKSEEDRPRWVYAASRPRKSLADGAVVYDGVEIEITDIKLAEIEKEKLQKQLLEKQKLEAVGRVAGKMAHDFNNILGITLGTSELLLAQDIAPEIKKEIASIKECATRGREITQSLLFFAKEQEAKYARMDLNERINAILRGMKQDLGKIELKLNFGAGLDNITADAGLIENAVINLLQNAVHATSRTKDAWISIRTHRKDDRIYIEVQDNGCGIPEKFQSHIYEPSFTLKGSMDRLEAYSKDIQGSGYGLANARRGIEKHGGSLDFVSMEGAGSRFFIELPFIEMELERPAETSISKTEATPGGRVLIIEDEVQFGSLLYRMLRMSGYKATLASSGREAIDSISENEFDVISLDYILPDISGVELYKFIREKDKEVPVIFVSGNFEFMQSMVDLKESDPNVDHIAKPFNFDEYYSLVCSWLKQ